MSKYTTSASMNKFLTQIVKEEISLGPKASKANVKKADKFLKELRDNYADMIEVEICGEDYEAWDLLLRVKLGSEF